MCLVVPVGTKVEVVSKWYGGKKVVSIPPIAPRVTLRNGRVQERQSLWVDTRS